MKNQIFNWNSKRKNKIKAIQKTCANCKHYHPILADPRDENDYHIHNYCSIWNAEIPDYTLFGRLGYSEGYSDIECGVAHCWCFESRVDGKTIDKFHDMNNNTKNDDEFEPF